MTSVIQELQRNEASGQSPQRVVNVERSGVQRTCFPYRFRLLVCSQNGSEGRAICVADVPARCVLARLAAARLTALAQDAINISGVGAFESETHVLERRACVKATFCHAEALQGFRNG